MKRDETTEQDETGDKAELKKPYQKPAILYREPLEAVASSCLDPPGKSSPAENCAFASS